MYILLAYVSCILYYYTVLCYIIRSLREGKVEPTLFHAKIPIDRSIRPTLECTLCSIALSLSCVMAGQGDARCLRVLRELRWKVEDINYGSHMAINMAIGKIYCELYTYLFVYLFVSCTCIVAS